MNRNIYIYSNFIHLLASNFTESLFLKFIQMFISGRLCPKYHKKKCYFFNNIFCKFKIVVCFAPLLHGVERNTILNFDSITDSVKSENIWKRKHYKEEAGRNGTSCSRVLKQQRRNRGIARKFSETLEIFPRQNIRYTKKMFWKKLFIRYSLFDFENILKISSVQ